MKKIFTPLLISLLCIVMAFSFTACKDNDSPNTGDGNSTTDTPAPTPTPEDIDPSTVDIITETWVATEINFESQKEYNYRKAEPLDVIMDVVFTNRNTGTSLTIPTFWSDDVTFSVRFAPTEYGIWDYKTVCETDDSLNGLTGTVGANAYKGDLDIYKHGFVTTNGSKYFVYADGTPFFYLGDTHWNMFAEEFDKPGTHAGDTGASSHFKYIVDKRVSQGFTVYQSEPIGAPFSLNNGFQYTDLRGFREADGYFQYIAEKGLVHANAQFFFASDMSEKLAEDDAYLEQIARYWVARWGAYPVIWTLAQEIDNDYYFERGNHPFWNYQNNPWIKVAEYIHKYDAYNHPLSGHQESTVATTITGAGTGSNTSGGGISVFFSNDVSQRAGHNWWAAQWKPSLIDQTSNDIAIAKDYWASPKVAINYESRYCYLWTKNFGARAQGWISYLNGLYGYGYGAIDMWYYNSTYDTDTETNDGIETVTIADKKTKWSTAIEFESGYQVGYMKQFFSSLNWWKLIPDFNDEVSFNPDKGSPAENGKYPSKALYTCATDGNDTYVVYFYNQTTRTGTLGNMDGNAVYTLQWFNPRTNQYIAISQGIKANTTDKNGAPSYRLPDKPDTEDWVLLATKN